MVLGYSFTLNSFLKHLVHFLYQMYTLFKKLFLNDLLFPISVHALANKKFADDPEDPDSNREVDYLKMLASPTLDSPPDPLPLYQKRDNFLQ